MPWAAEDGRPPELPAVVPGPAVRPGRVGRGRRPVGRAGVRVRLAGGVAGGVARQRTGVGAGRPNPARQPTSRRVRGFRPVAPTAAGAA